MTPLNYTKNWTSASDFPTVELNEAQVRADMQLLFDEIQNYINNTLISNGEGGEGEIGSTAIPFHSTIAALATYTTIKDAIEYVYSLALQTAQTSIGEHAVQNINLSRTSDVFGGAVKNDNIVDGEIDLTTKVANVLPVTNGGLGVDISSSAGKATARVNLGLGACAVEEILPIGKGGLGTSMVTAAGKAVARTNLGLGDCAVESVLPVAKGGTGKSTLAEVQTWLGLGSVAYDSVVPLSRGGIGVDATTTVGKATARENLNAQEKYIACSVTLEGGQTNWEVNVDGVTVSNAVIVTPAPSSFFSWRNFGVYCAGQLDGKLTFVSEAAPSSALTANIIILN